MTVSIRPLDDCIIRVSDVHHILVYDTNKFFLDCPLLKVMVQKFDDTVDYYDDVCDLEVF